MFVEERDIERSEDFDGILFERSVDAPALAEEQPAGFHDLQLDRFLDTMLTDRRELGLERVFFTPLRDPDAVRFRQEVFRDLEDPDVLGCVERFTEQMRVMRVRLRLAEDLRYPYEKERWFLDAATSYRDAVLGLRRELAEHRLGSRGLRAFRDYVRAYVDAHAFASFAKEVADVTAALAQVRYLVHIRGDRVTVGPYEGERDFSEDVVATFAKFRQGAVRDYEVKFTSGRQLDHIEAKILELVARAYPEPFAALARFTGRHAGFRDEVIRRFDREIQFYLAYLGCIGPLKEAGLPFCYPETSRSSKETAATDVFDPVLALSLLRERSSVVRNDFSLRGPERLLVVTGPNQGGKTTFARMVGQVHHLASVGCPVPGTRAALFLPDRIFAHFEREEDIATLRGKLEDELVRIREILGGATGDSLVIMNESFASTTLSDALFLGTEVIRRLIELDALGVYVTFVDELASVGDATVSMVGLVDPDDPAIRTFSIVRKPPDGLAYAAAIADKHGLSAGALRRRLGR